MGPARMVIGSCIHRDHRPFTARSKTARIYLGVFRVVLLGDMHIAVAAMAPHMSNMPMTMPLAAVSMPPSVLDSTAAERLFPSTFDMAFIQPAGLGAPRASKSNPGGAGNAEGNWWTPSAALDTDCEGKPVRSPSELSKECIYEKKVAEIKARQAISAENGQFKVDKLANDERKATADAEKKARAAAETKARHAKYAGKM